MPVGRLPAAFGLAFLGSFSVLLHRHLEFMPPFLARLQSSGPDPCPSPDLAALPILHDLQTCEEIPSALPEFRTELCRAHTSCSAFTLRIARTDPRACEIALVSNLYAPSDETQWEAWMEAERGPDGFYLRVDGAQRFATEHAVHEGSCAYRMDVVLQNPGRAYLTAAHYYEDYNAYNERNATWAENLDRPLFNQPIEFDVCDSSCPAYSPHLLNPARSTLAMDDASRLTSDLSSPPPDADLPACDGDDPISGVYVPHHPLDALYPPVPYPVGHKVPVHGRYRFVPEGCRFRHAGLRFGDPSLCTERAERVLFIGDSHGRVAYDAMVHRLSGATDMMTKSEKVHDKNATLGALSLNFVWDPQLNHAAPTCAELSSLLDEVNIFVVSAGAHWRSTAKFLADLTQLFGMMSDCQLEAPPARMIFLTTPAVAPRQDQYVQMHKDKRTSTRQGYLARRSAELARAYGWKVVDQFALTEAHTVELMALDRAHYVGTDAIDPIVDELIQKAGVCDGM